MKTRNTFLLLLSIFLFVNSQKASAQSVFMQVAAGNWNNLSTWTVGGMSATTLPGPSDYVFLYPDAIGPVTIPSGFNPGTVFSIYFYVNASKTGGTFTAINNNSGYPLTVTNYTNCITDNTATNKTFTITINASGTGSSYVFNGNFNVQFPIGNGDNVIYQLNAPSVTFSSSVFFSSSTAANATALTSARLEIMPGTTLNAYYSIGFYWLHTNINTGTNATFQTDAGSTFNIYSAAVFGSLSASLVNYVYFNGNVNYLANGAQTIYTTSTANLANASTFGYSNLTIGNTTGIASVNSGVLNVSGNFTNSTNNSASNYIDFTTNRTTVNLNGSTQTLSTSASGNQTRLYNLTVASTTSASLSGAAGFAISSKGILTLSTAAALNANGLLTLLSDVNGCASVAPILNGGTVNGNVIVQRYLSGSSSGINYRGYRLIASPVYLGTLISIGYFKLQNLISATFLTGSTGSAGGFDKAGNPTLYLFEDYYTPANYDFISGNWGGVSSINLSLPTYPYCFNLSNNYSNIIYWFSGSGMLLFFRGSRSTVNPYTTTSYAQPSTIADTGTLTTGTVFACPYDKITSYGALNYHVSSGNAAVRGFNLMGNPYACTIDWNTSTTGGIIMTNVSNTIYELNLNGTYGTYQWDGTTGIATNNGSRYIASGEGFFVKATSASATFKFTENAKAASANYNPVMGTLPTTQLALHQNTSDQHLLLSMQMDSVNYEETYLGFSANSSTKLTEDEDARYLFGSSKVHLASMSSDTIALAINRQPLPGLAGTNIHLKVSATASGNYLLNLKEISNIPSIYKLWLTDNYLKDSVDLRITPAYKFAINNGDSSSYGTGRFLVSIHQDTGLRVKLLSFTAQPNLPKTVNLQWLAKNEFNYTHFSVGKSTDGGKTYTIIDSLLSTGAGTYSFTDNQPLKGNTWYQLCLTDLNGTKTYSQPVLIIYSPGSKNDPVRVFPNPAKNQINVTIDQETGNFAEGDVIKIYNAAGLEVLSGQISKGQWQGNVAALGTGTYLAVVYSNAKLQAVGSAKFLKQ